MSVLHAPSRVRAQALGHLPHIALALAFTAVMAFLGLVGFAFSDYDVEASAAFWALRTGDLEGFLAAVPAYGGSFVLRAPFAWAPALWGGGELAVFRAVSLPGLAACAGLAVFVAGRMREMGRSRLDRVVVLGALTASPAALSALEFGHPEELLGGALCVAAVLAARRRPIVAGVLVGLAVANKPWALVAVPVVLAAVPVRSALPSALACGGVAGAVLAPLLLFGGGFAEATVAVGDTGAIFTPWQVWFLLGEPGRLPPQMGMDGLRHAPGWLMPLTRPLILTVPVVAAGVWWWRRRGVASVYEPLLLLALVLHLRCWLDPWNFTYYALPALLALATWEALERRDRPPFLTLAFIAVHWITFEHAGRVLGADGASVVYLAWALPLTGWMVHRLLGRSSTSRAFLARG
ncbi:MAG: hypothetical protein MSC31_09360 [Solirubrobacteraceae bacterium MAG38_C4-C5]|nr:hypothetical protein [Candidatus Siliceabacter maunaloa]